MFAASALALSPISGAGAAESGLRQRIEALQPQALHPVACCKTCRKGKACGDSCISRDKTCRKGPGCACDG
ncbi:hypothetical protein Ga0080574_TMP4171 [Salipiger abyssi]|uniref:Uncharacterized protein n=1 Tax=Salipiger abyssi TaxID=1250539 RepID=A0A1P8UYN2_9RHOB|nr:hypothetical protein Ga0080574_TMP4171 [Salipiger abyssi]